MVRFYVSQGLKNEVAFASGVVDWFNARAEIRGKDVTDEFFISGFNATIF